MFKYKQEVYFLQSGHIHSGHIQSDTIYNAFINGNKEVDYMNVSSDSILRSDDGSILASIFYCNIDNIKPKTKRGLNQLRVKLFKEIKHSLSDLKSNKINIGKYLV